MNTQRSLWTKRSLVPTVFCAAFLAASGAHADLLFFGPNTASGTGLGAVNSLVTAHDPGGSGDNNGTESACIEATSTGDVTSPCHFLAGEQGGDNVTGAGNNTYTLASLASSTNPTVDAGELALVVNVAEPGNDTTVTLTDLYLSAFNGTTTDYFHYTGGPLVLNQDSQSPNGTGQSGFLFYLSAAEAAEANTFCSTGTCVIGGGVQFAAGTTANGNETVYITSLPAGVPPQEIPEPGVLSLLGAGLIAFVARKRRKGR